MTTSAIGGASRARERDLEPEPSPVAKVGRHASVEEIARSAVSEKIDADLAAFIESVLDPKPTPKNDEILYVGTNIFSAGREARAIAAHGAPVRVATAPDLTDTRAFVDALGVPKDVADRIAHVLDGAPPEERKFLAAIAFAWAAAERGGTCPSRLVISGHSGGGTDIWGSEGEIKLENVRLLAKAMPHAASQVEDIHLSACSTSANGASPRDWRAAFPHLTSLWCYDGSAPSPASSHLVAWAQMTRGRAEPRLTEDLKHASVGLWTKSHGYTERHRTLSEVRADARVAHESVAALLDGTNVPSSHDERHVVATYRALRRLASRPDATKAEKARANADGDAVLRIRYYDVVRTQFAKTHGATIAHGFRALGLAPPDFARLSRKDAVAVIASFEAALARHPRPPAAAVTAASSLRGLATLDPNVVPERWCAE
jgi:hypothetical protein